MSAVRGFPCRPSQGHGVAQGGGPPRPVLTEEGLREAAAVLEAQLPQYLSGIPNSDIYGLMDFLLKARARARKAGDYVAADAIRERLSSLGVRVNDYPSCVRWKGRVGRETVIKFVVTG